MRQFSIFRFPINEQECPMIWAELEGPSKTIVVEPIEAPTTQPEPLPERTPAPVREPVKVPA